MPLPVEPYLRPQSWNIYQWSESDPKYCDRYSGDICPLKISQSPQSPPWHEALLPISPYSSGRVGSHHLDTNRHIESTGPGKRFVGKQRNHPPPLTSRSTLVESLQPVLERFPRQ